MEKEKDKKVEGSLAVELEHANETEDQRAFPLKLNQEVSAQETLCTLFLKSNNNDI